jgi:hypothetical protein
MRRVLFISIVLISSLACWCSSGNGVNLSTPEKTLRSYYEGFKRSDFEYQKKTLLSSIEVIGKERFHAVSPVLQTYEIVKMREAKDRKDDTFHLPEDDIQAIVKEIHKNGKESINSFVLRKVEGKWLIVGFDTVNEAEFPPDIKVIEDETKKMFEQKGKK